MAVDPITALFEVGKSVIERIWPDPAAQATALFKLEALRQTGDLAALTAEVSLLTGQMDINKEEAKHPSIFVAGWRPFVGWVGGFALAYASILEPLMKFTARVSGYSGEFPELNVAIVIQVLMGMLGIGAMRSYDKIKNKQTNRTE